MGRIVYIETSIVSYLTALPARDILAAARQNATRRWWETRRGSFDLVASQLVFDEAAEGNREAAERRLRVLAGIRHLAMPAKVIALGGALVAEGAMPQKALDDALHLAVCAYHGVDYLLTWNCRHLANAEMKPLMRSVCVVHGCGFPEICSPMELMGEDDEG